MEQRGEQGPWRDVVTPELAQYIAERDALYLGTATADGRPYIQYRGGPKGFLKVLDEHTLAFGDYAGNAQYISLGNLSENNKAFIFLMDYPNRHRVKIWGTAEFIEGDSELLQRVVNPGYKARPERVLRFHVQAWSPNCHQHIKPRFTVEEMAPTVQKLQRRIAELEATIVSLRKRVGEAAPKPAVSEPCAQLIAALITEAPPEGPGCGIR
jgi:predicted pyridoxine 5'-phosphate oxidase superfamily flavin-nucleotide-binding protein